MSEIANQTNQTNSIITIRNFNQINIIPNSLVVLDVDETLIRYDGIDYRWWKSKFNRFYKETNNCELAEFLSNEEWIRIISNCNPELVDENIHNFIELLRQNNCHIILLTARSNNLRELTENHLNTVNLSFEHIYFNSEKGDALRNIISNDYPEITNVIVVDDMIQNLIDIQNKNTSASCTLHLYNIK